MLDKARGFVAIDDYERVHHHLELINVLGDGNCFWRALHCQVDRPPTRRHWWDLKDDVTGPVAIKSPAGLREQ